MDNAAELTTAQVMPTPSLGKPLLDTPASDLPGWPPFLTFLLFGWVIVAWIVGIVLFYATFPKKVEWLVDFVVDLIHGRCTDEYAKTHRRLQTSHANRMLRIESSPHPGEQHISTDSNQNSAATATGLGISFDGPPTNTLRFRRPLGSDPESLELLKKDFFDIPKTKEEFYRTFSAPLPSRRRFAPSTPSPTITKHDEQSMRMRHRRADLERGLQSDSSAPGSLEVVGRDVWMKEQGKSRRGYGITAFLESVNAGIDFVAGKLAKMTSDDARDGAESGLVLPVRNAEREHAGAEVV